MLDKLDVALAGKILIVIPSCLVVFHIVNLLGFIPLNITWLGQIDSNRTMVIMGLVSICLNLVLILCALVTCHYWNSPFLSPIVEKILPWVFYWLVGNTIANLFSKSTFEVVVFTPILLILTVCMYKIKNHTQHLIVTD